jgi:hypothetical protein
MWGMVRQESSLDRPGSLDLDAPGPGRPWTWTPRVLVEREWSIPIAELHLVSSQIDAFNARWKFYGKVFPAFDIGKFVKGNRAEQGLLAKGSGLLS